MNLIQKVGARLLGLKAAANISNGRFVYLNGAITYMEDNLKSYVDNAYKENDIIYSLCNLVMDKTRQAPWGLFKVVDEGSLKKYHSVLQQKGDKDLVQLAKLQNKALEPLENFNVQQGRLNDLLKYSNEYETFNDLVANGVGYKLITGNRFLWADILDAGANKGVPNELYNLPSQYMQLLVTGQWPQRVVGYKLSAGNLIEFPRETVMHEKFWNPDYDINGTNLYGQSPLRAASKRITKNNAATKAASVLFDNNGAVGIAYVDDPIIPVAGRQEQAQQVKATWAKEYAGSDNFGKVAISGYKMGYTNIGVSLREMALKESEEIDLRALCNIWGVPSQLMNDAANKAEANAMEAEKALTSRCVMTHLTAFRDNFNRMLHYNWGFKGANIIADYDVSVYRELQDDQKTKWDWVNKLPVSGRYKMEMMGLDVPDDPMMDEILIEGNMMPLADVLNKMSTDELQQINDNLAKAGLHDYLRAR
jgi:HK97 family phage portal protein